MKTNKIALGSLGGTVSMTKEQSDKGVTPKLTAEDLVSSLGGSQVLMDLDIIAENIFKIPSSYIQFDHLLKCYDWAKNQIENGAKGVVLTQGTDTLEETAFLLDLIWDFDEPLILTGAMRSPDQAGADGPANLLAALIAATSDNSRGRGALVVMNNWIYEAKWVAKKHTSDVDAFHAETGPAGIVFEEKVAYFKAVSPRAVFIKPASINSEVVLYQSSLSDSISTLNVFVKQADAIVISSFGAGHVSKEMAEEISVMTSSMPVIISSSTLGGSTAYSTYGYVGAEIDLQKKGVIMSGWLSPKKSRILATIALANREDVRLCFERYLSSMVH